MAENKRLPALRFAGFDDAWKCKKLSEIATMHARIGWQNLRKSEFLNSGEYYLITGTDFVDGEIDFGHCHYVARTRYEQDPNIKVQRGSILITKDGTLGKVAFIRRLNKPATLNAGVFNVIIKDRRSIYDKYLYQYLKAPYLLDYVAQRATGGTIKHLNQGILVDFPVVHPRYEEQVLLGDCFEHFDDLITQQQREYERLLSVKKAMLEKMFPREGCDVPEIRFAGFTEPWVRRKINQIADIIGGGTPSTAIPEYWDGCIDWYAPAEIGDQVYVSGSVRTITEKGLQNSSAIV